MLTRVVDYERYGLPDFGVYTTRSEGLYIWAGPQGRRNHVLRLERRVRRLGRAVEHVAEGQEKSREHLRDVLEELTGS